MKRVCLLVAAVAVVLLVGCAHVLIHPHAEGVKRVAVVSAYMNRTIYNVEAPHQGDGEGLGALVKAAAKAGANKLVESTLGDIQGYQPVVANGLKVFSDSLNVPGRWESVSPVEVVGHEKYQEFLAAGETGGMSTLMKGAAAISTADFVTVEGMIVIPIDSIVEAGNVHHFGSETSYEKMQKRLGELAVALDVDAVAVLELDAAYEPKALNLPVGLKRGIPNVSIAAVMVDREGNVAMKTPLVTRGQGKRHEGETTRMLRNDAVVMSDDEVQSAYNQVFGQAVSALQTTIVEEFAKLSPAQTPAAPNVATETAGPSPIVSEEPTAEAPDASEEAPAADNAL